MSDATIDVDRLVREVLDRLRQAGSGEEQRGASCEPCAEASGDAILQIDEKVVSHGLLEGRLSGVKAIEVVPGSVITPAARDYLQQCGVAVHKRESCGCEKQNANTLLLAVASTALDQERLSSALRTRGVAVHTLEGDDMIRLVDDIREALARDSDAAVLCTNQPEVATSLANRLQAIRAAQVTGAASMNRATEELGANLLIVDPAGRSILSLAHLIERFATRRPKNCPPQYIARLG